MIDVNSFIAKFLAAQGKQQPASNGREGFNVARPTVAIARQAQKGYSEPFEDENVNVDTPEGDVDVNQRAPLSGDFGSELSGNDAITQTLAKIRSLQTKDYGKGGHGGIKDILRSAGISALSSVANADPRGGIGSLIGAGIGGAAAGGIGGGVDKRTDDKALDDIRLQRLYGEYGQQAKVADNEQNRTLKKEQIKDIPARRQQAMDALAEKRRAAEETLKQRKRDAFYRTHKNFDATKATQADINALAEFGETPETIGTFDFTKPNVQTIAGQKFLFNANTRAFEDAGLPKDGSKAIIDYTVVDPTTGVESKYSTTSEKAAGLKNQLAAAGLQIQAAERRQDKQIAQENKRLALDTAKFTEAKKQYQQTFQLRQDMFNAAQDARAKGDEQKAKEYDLKLDNYDRMLQQMRMHADEGLTSGELTKEQYDALSPFWNK